MNTKSIADILKVAYKMEIQGQEFYKSKLSNIKSPNLKITFEYLANMEKDHAKFIKDQIERINNNEPLQDLPKDESDPEELFEKQSEDMEEADPDFGDYTVTRLAVLIEKDFEGYYKLAAENQSDDDLKRMFTTLSRWERSHANILKGRLRNIIKKNAIEEKFFEPLY